MAELILDWAEWLDERVDLAAQRLSNWMQRKLHLRLLFQYLALVMLTSFVFPSPKMNQTEVLLGRKLPDFSDRAFEAVIDITALLLGFILLAWLGHALAKESGHLQLRPTLRRTAWSIAVAIGLEMLLILLSERYQGRGDLANVLLPLRHWTLFYYVLLLAPRGGGRRRRKRIRVREAMQSLFERLGQLNPKPI